MVRGVVRVWVIIPLYSFSPHLGALRWLLGGFSGLARFVHIDSFVGVNRHLCLAPCLCL